MKNQPHWRSISIAGALLLTAPAFGAEPAAPIALRYAMKPGSTNAYTLTISQQGESGRETLTGTLVASARKEGDAIALSFKGQLRPKITPGAPPMFMGYRPGGPVQLNSYLGYGAGPYSESREMVVDQTGKVLRLSGDSALPVPLGSLLGSFLVQFPTEPAGGWEKEENVFLLDEPLLAGPAPVFQMSAGPMAYYPGRPAQAVLAATQKTSVKVTEATADLVTLEKKSVLNSTLLTGKEPRASGTAQVKLILDRAEGWPRLIEVDAQSAALTENLSRRSQLTLKWQLLEGAEREAALTPPPPPSQEVTGNELNKLMTDLKSDNPSTRQMAARQLTMGGRTLNPTPELLAEGTRLAAERDDASRDAGLAILASCGGREQVPTLIRSLNETIDSSLRMSIAKALGRIRDPRAAEPLAQLVATGQVDQSTFYRRDTPVTEALIKIGPPAESAVLPLLKEKHADTRILACAILKQIGSKRSLPALKELTGNSVKELSEAAAEAARSIQNREKAD